MLKYLEVMLNIFQFPHEKEIVESWLVYRNKFSWIIQIMFPDRDNKTKLVPVSFSNFLELLWEKNKL